MEDRTPAELGGAAAGWMMAGGNWWRAYEIGFSQAGYRHR
jgi:hypothetical protein